MLPGVSYAQHEHRATVVMRNGDRVSGALEDVEKGTVYVRVSLNDQRRLDQGNVALIDFVGGGQGLPASETSIARGADSLAVMRDGSSLQGRFIDIRGGEEGAQGETHRLVFRTTDGNERVIPLDQVGRVYLGNFPAANLTDNNTPYTKYNDPAPPGTVRVPANAAWTATPLYVQKGDRITFNTSGRIQLSGDGEDIAHAAGSLRQRYANRAPLPQFYAGALIGKIGNSAPFAVGDNNSIVAPATGQLYLGINDDELSDNRGEFSVELGHSKGSRRR